MWNTVLNAPFSRPLEVAVIDDEGEHPLVFPCERTQTGWKHAVTGVPIAVMPTHWRDWQPPVDSNRLFTTSRHAN
ncbi:MAG: hypothetical protein EOS66_04065 [Mesorhizobium sp.]|nr:MULTISPECIES: hypothetical protein [unclassified Mesorhizobium]RWF59934.1 MAG: hypothetical protein EOS66_04065 [Mesorhizobium sp.]RVC97456.1 hypothetical protein EN739_04515 [Mesorhizobium sp. M2A.F.Ca.ET.017.03.2.1]RVD10615.1 hypothetical protein EN753_05660 [Mesorhizobium sp. M2A.F.Ca.ET.029.05.1.1]TIW58952.1 MAG: hypothetical protein E5V54_01090 [Mesorhizobium sp.]TIW82440.1 MAG: hypothetical protein E5V53_08335 [Mesorhizobium sp.]